MKKILYILLLLNQVSLKGMAEGDVTTIMQDPSLTNEDKINWYLENMKLPESMDSTIKKDISVDDPQAFEKIVRYVDMLIPAFKTDIPLAVKLKLSSKQYDDLQKMPKTLENVKRKFAFMVTNMPKKEVSNNGFLAISQQIRERSNAKNIVLWNTIKTTALITLDTIKKIEQGNK